MPFEQNIESAQKAASGAAYMVSGGLVAGDWAGVLNWMNENAGVIGIGLGAATYFTNLYFQIRRERRESQQA